MLLLRVREKNPQKKNPGFNWDSNPGSNPSWIFPLFLTLSTNSWVPTVTYSKKHQACPVNMSATWYITGGMAHKTHCTSVGLYEMERQYTGAVLSGSQCMCWSYQRSRAEDCWSREFRHHWCSPARRDLSPVVEGWVLPPEWNRLHRKTSINTLFNMKEKGQGTELTMLAIIAGEI